MFDNIINWIIGNSEWVFSGIGVTILLGIIGLVRRRLSKNSDRERPIKIEQNNTGQNSTQIGIQNNYCGGTKDDR